MAKLPPYQYKGQPVKKEAIREIFDIYWPKITVFSKKNILTRAEIINAIDEFHILNKGKKSDLTGNVNKILKEYAKKFPARIKPHKARGLWHLNLSNRKVTPEKEVKSVRKASQKKPEFILTPKKTIGIGHYKVYVFYDKLSKGCKVGKTKNTVEARYAQFKTAIAIPWSLEVLVLYKTGKEMDLFEQTLKNILKLNKYQPSLVPKAMVLNTFL